MIKTHSAGIVIIRYDNNVPQILLMRAYSYWDFPKGGVEKDENKLMAAIREVREESGIVDLNFRWGKVFYETEPYGKTRKVVSYFLAETTEKQIVMGVNPDIGKPEHEEYRWVNFEDAYHLAGDRIKKVLSWAQDRITIVDSFNKESLLKC